MSNVAISDYGSRSVNLNVECLIKIMLLRIYIAYVYLSPKEYYRLSLVTCIYTLKHHNSSHKTNGIYNH